MINNFHEGKKSILTRIIYENELYPIVATIIFKDEKYYLDIFCDKSLYLSSNVEDVYCALEYNINSKRIISFSDFKNHDYLNILPSEFKHPNVVISDESLSIFTSFLEQSNQPSNLSFCYIKAKINTDDFEWFQLNNTMCSISNPNIRYIYFNNINSNFAQRMSMMRKNLKDPLTGLLQKDSIKEYIQDYILLSSDKKGLVAIVDIDYFKQVNDTYGHTFGDIVLSRIAHILESISTKNGRNGKVGRIGGDEFILFIPNISNYDQLKEIGREIKYGVSTMVFDELKSFFVTSTSGIVAFPKNGVDYDLLYKKADKALYRGKHKGRNCYIIYDEDIHGSVNGETEMFDLKSITDSIKKSYTEISLISKVIEVLVNSDLDDLDLNIKSCIDETGKFFNLDRIVLRMNYGTSKFDHDYLYAEKFNSGVENHEIKNFESLEDYYDIENIFLYKDRDFALFRVPKISEILLGFNNYAMVIVKFKLEDNSFGYICFEMTNNRRIWEKEEILVFKVISQLIGTFVRRYIKKYNKLP